MRRFDEDTPEGREQAKVWRWRYRAALRAGCSRLEAEILADCEIDSHDVGELAVRGCPPKLIVELLV